MTAEQLADLRGRLEAEIGRCVALQAMSVAYAAEANAYRRVLATLDGYGPPAGLGPQVTPTSG